MTVSNDGGLKFKINTRSFEFVTDQYIEHGGTNEGPTPVEYFIASMGSCIAIFAKNFLIKHGFAEKNVDVEVDWEMKKCPNRVGIINATLNIEGGIDDLLKDSLLAVVNHCTIHNSLNLTPEIDIKLGE